MSVPRWTNQMPSPWNVRAWIEGNWSWTSCTCIFQWRCEPFWDCRVLVFSIAQFSVLSLMLRTTPVSYSSLIWGLGHITFASWLSQSGSVAYHQRISTNSSTVSTNFTITQKTGLLKYHALYYSTSDLILTWASTHTTINAYTASFPQMLYDI